MEPLEIVVLLIVAGICGALGQTIGGFSRGGFVASIALGFIGALLGTWIARTMELPAVIPLKIGSTEFPVIWSIVGAALFVAVLGLLTRGRRSS